MAKKITFKYAGVEYTLEFTRRTFENMENRGFNLDNIRTRPMNTLPALFAGALEAHHGTMKRSKADEILSMIKDKSALYDKLMEMYAETVDTLFDDPSEDEGNVEWGASW